MANLMHALLDVIERVVIKRERWRQTERAVECGSLALGIGRMTDAINAAKRASAATT